MRMNDDVMADLRADRGDPQARRRPRLGIVCKILGHVPVPAVDEWDLIYVRCRSCRRDLTLDA